MNRLCGRENVGTNLGRVLQSPDVDVEDRRGGGGWVRAVRRVSRNVIALDRFPGICRLWARSRASINSNSHVHLFCHVVVSCLARILLRLVDFANMAPIMETFPALKNDLLIQAARGNAARSA